MNGEEGWVSEIIRKWHSQDMREWLNMWERYRGRNLIWVPGFWFECLGEQGCHAVRHPYSSTLFSIGREEGLKGKSRDNRYTISQGLLKLMSTEMVMPSNHLILPLSPASLPALSLSQHQGLFQWVASSHQVAKVLEFQLQQQSFQWLFRVDFLYDWLVWSCYPKDPQESSPAPQVKSINSLVLSLLYGPTLNSGEGSLKR